MLVLGIESSCDETAAAVVLDGKKPLSNVIASQHEIHAPYGGIVPELASRRHVENIPVVIREALRVADVELGQIDVFAVTRGPGLVGALLVGLSTAKALAWSEGKPLVAVNHLHGHAVAAELDNDEQNYPRLCLLVSGGHTSIYSVDSPVSMEALASTRDDAAGEAFDKVAKMLGLGYPGGPALEKAAEKGDEYKIPFPVPNVKGRPLDFSFSGLKTAVRNLLHKRPAPKAEDVAASFQKTVTEILRAKMLAAAKQFGLKEIVVAGGVASNRYLRNGLQKAADEAGCNIFFPEPVFCTDNAAMIASAGFFLYKENPDDVRFRDFLALDAVANLPL
ncbi:MAG: tRNA N6-adenosine threonylcarbamoyltransferase [bacterium]|nr:MAG: tRNA N6-adenosine threonylcarbamoyltransferase [bacterium]